MAWELTPALDSLNREFGRHAPGRDTTSDGVVGDDAHALVVSDHNPDETGRVPITDADNVNEVHATDRDATGPWPWAGGMETAVQFLVARCRSGAENRLRYIIYNRRIWEASNGWRERAYPGANAHIEHAHFSGSYDPLRERDTRSWHLEEIPIMITEAEWKRLQAIVERAVDRRMGDRIRYYDAAGELVPETDDNPTIDGGTALQHLLRNTNTIMDAVAVPGVRLSDDPPTT